MGDYYKIKKLLLICMIVLTIMRIFKGSNVFAAEIVNPKETSGNFTIQYDNTWQTLRDWTKDAQSKYCTLLLKQLDNDYYHDNVITTINTIYNYMMASNPNRLLYFEDLVVAGSYNSFIVRVYPINALAVSSNIVQSGLTLDNCYNFPNVPFLQYTRNSANPNIIVDVNGQIVSTITDGQIVSSPVPCLACYSDLWLQVFDKAGIVKSEADYTDVLDNINGTQELIYQQELSQSYYASESNTIISNTYDFLENENHIDETSMPFQTITATDPYSFDDFLDNLENILTNENYVPKQFTLTLPNNRSFNFSINPNMTEQLLTRIGGQNVYGLITIMWYMGIYGIIIFDFKRMLNQILSGDWMHITTDSSPIDNVVSASFNATGATSTSTSHSGGDR